MVGEEFFDDFEQEADLMKRLRHPNVLQFLGNLLLFLFRLFLSYFFLETLCLFVSFLFCFVCLFVFLFARSFVWFIFVRFLLLVCLFFCFVYVILCLGFRYSCWLTSFFANYLGACLIPPDICILMEYMPKGSLYRILHTQVELQWELLNRMALDAARGMNYLHCSEPQILHRDLKSHNLLVSLILLFSLLYFTLLVSFVYFTFVCFSLLLIFSFLYCLLKTLFFF